MFWLIQTFKIEENLFFNIKMVTVKVFNVFFYNMQISVMYLVYVELSFEWIKLERDMGISKKRAEALLTSSLLK